MSYESYVLQEHEPSLLMMFSWVTFENQIEDTSNLFLSQPMQSDQIIVRDRTIIPGERKSLFLSGDRVEPIRFSYQEEFPEQDFTLIFWFRVYDSEVTVRRGMVRYGDLSIAVDKVESGQFELVVRVNNKVIREIFVTGDYMLTMTRQGDNFSMYIRKDGEEQPFFFSESNVDISESSFRVGTARLFESNVDAELDIQGVTLLDFPINEQQRQDIYTVVDTNRVVRGALESGILDFAEENIKALQTEWHSVLI